MLTMIVLMAMASPLPATRPASRRRALPAYNLPKPKPKRCTGTCAAQYRLPLEVNDDDPTSKDRALAQDGTRCNVVGAKRCTSKTRTILRSNEDLADTLSGSLTPK